MENGKQQVILVKAGEPIPWDYTPTESLDIPAIDPASVRAYETQMVDVTSSEDHGPYRNVIAGPAIVLLNDGTKYTASAELLALAFQGGGKFVRAYLNEPYTCQTLEEYEAELDREAEEAAYEYW